MITVGQLLDLIDCNRESEDFVDIMNDDSKVEVHAMVCSDIWKSIENRQVDCIGAEKGVIVIWLKSEED